MSSLRHRSSSTCTGARAGFSPPAPPPCTSSERTGLARAPAMSKHCPCCWITWCRCPGGLSSASPAAAASTACRAAGDMLSCVEADWHQDPARALHCIYHSFPGFRNPLGPYLKGHWWGAHAFCPFCPSTSPVHLDGCPSGPPHPPALAASCSHPQAPPVCQVDLTWVGPPEQAGRPGHRVEPGRSPDEAGAPSSGSPGRGRGRAWTAPPHSGPGCASRQRPP